MTGGQDEAAEQLDTSNGISLREMAPKTLKICELTRQLEAAIEERDEARGIVGTLLLDPTISNVDRSAWKLDFPWLKEYLP